MWKRNVRTTTLVAAAVVSMFLIRGVDGAVVLSLQEVGDDVVATASGTADVTGLTLALSGVPVSALVAPDVGFLLVGNPVGDVYIGMSSGPSSFGSGAGIDADSSTGGLVGPDGSTLALTLPGGYASGDPLSGSSTWENHTLSSLGVTPGTYEWTWGTDSITLNVIDPNPPPPTGTVPTLSEWGMIALVLLLGAAAATAQNRQRRKAVARA